MGDLKLWVSHGNVITFLAFLQTNFAYKKANIPSLQGPNVIYTSFSNVSIEDIVLSSSNMYIRPRGVILGEVSMRWTSRRTAPLARATMSSYPHVIAKPVDTKNCLFGEGGRRHTWTYVAKINPFHQNTPLWHLYMGSPWYKPVSFRALRQVDTEPSQIQKYFGKVKVISENYLFGFIDPNKGGVKQTVIQKYVLEYHKSTRKGRLRMTYKYPPSPQCHCRPYLQSRQLFEQTRNFSNYRARFSMPNYESMESLFYSWNMGPVHFIAVHTDAYYFLNFGTKLLHNLYEWLINDLEEATKPSMRAQRPWIILYGHEPMYCSNSIANDCRRKDCLVRVGLPVTHEYPMETLLDKYGVDLAVWAHEHSYERLWPLYNYTVLNGSYDSPYTNPRGPVHFTTGSAGCDETHDGFRPEQPDWSAFRSLDYGYTRLFVHNETHLNWHQVSDDQEGEIIDDVWLIRDHHLPYPEIRNKYH
ncbi:unnamed protein product, partial [Meganyctiphanes norvegica]